MPIYTVQPRLEMWMIKVFGYNCTLYEMFTWDGNHKKPLSGLGYMDSDDNVDLSHGINDDIFVQC